MNQASHQDGVDGGLDGAKIASGVCLELSCRAWGEAKSSAQGGFPRNVGSKDMQRGNQRFLTWEHDDMCWVFWMSPRWARIGPMVTKRTQK